MPLELKLRVRFMRLGCQSTRPVSRETGFTLIELMVIAAILAILSSIAVTSYTRYIARAHRADARTQLVQASQFMQRFYAANDSYLKDRAGNSVNTQAPQSIKQSPSDGVNPLYLLEISVDDNDLEYILKMAPKDGGSMGKDECGSFTLTSTNIRGVIVSGIAGDSVLRDSCWK